MRSIARQTARLASHTRSTSCDGIRQPAVPCRASSQRQQQRSFRSSVPRHSDARPRPDQSAGLAQQNDSESKIGNAEARSDQIPGNEHGEAKTNGERSVGGGRLRRQRRQPEIPKPPPIPKWFLEHNVTLVRATEPALSHQKGPKDVLRCVDAKTGHTLFTAPYYTSLPRHESLPAQQKLGTTWVRGQEYDLRALRGAPWKIDELNALDEEARAKLLANILAAVRSITRDEVWNDDLRELLASLPQDMKEQMLRAEDEDRRGRQPPDSSSKVDGVATDSPVNVAAEHRDTAQRFVGVLSDLKGTRLKHDFFDHNSFPKALRPRSVRAPARDAVAHAPLEARKAAQDAVQHPLAPVFLELQTGALASLSSTGENYNASFASSRVDLSLNCPDSDYHRYMDELVEDFAESVQADIVRLDANDFEDLTGDYVGQGHDGQGSFSALGYDAFEGYCASEGDRASRGMTGSAEEMDIDEDEQGEEDEDDASSSKDGSFSNLSDLRKAVFEQRHEIGKALSGINLSGMKVFQIGHNRPFPRLKQADRARPQGFVWDEARLDALLDRLIGAAKQKRLDAAQSASLNEPHMERPSDVMYAKEQRASSYQSSRRGRANPYVSHMAATYYMLQPLYEQPDSSTSLLLSRADEPAEVARDPSETPRTVIHVRDLKDICRSRLGEAVIDRLVHVVQKRRRSGERVVIVGTTAQDSDDPDESINDRKTEDFRQIVIPPLFNVVASKDAAIHHRNVESERADEPAPPGHHRILEVNLRHLQSMLRRLRPGQDIDLMSPKARAEMSLRQPNPLADQTYSMAQVQRLVMIALGLSETHARSDRVRPIHVAMASYIADQADHVVMNWFDWLGHQKVKRTDKEVSRLVESSKTSKDGKQRGPTKSERSKVDTIRDSCNAHEKSLLHGVVDANAIKVGFHGVHATPETITALKSLTSLSLMRPEAFKYGVLASDRLPGLLLYGPPGTGKTMLAKAVAKESGATVLEVTGAQIYEKYVGEGEKMVRAVFTLARKLSPCVVFIDEADAIFGTRGSASNRTTHREIINQFLREWDGMDDHSVFMMVATNRPFDLDDAVLRRLPRRLLIDLPVAKDRESILRIHLTNETLDHSVSLSRLAEQTPLYSGSDLKNLCVAAALACVREENELAASKKDDKDFVLPEKRTLTSKHFETAIKEISASISEDMRSLTAIKKFDEQFGDRRGRAKKAGFGFGGAGVVDENAVRVRQMAPEVPATPPAAPGLP